MNEEVGEVCALQRPVDALPGPEVAADVLDADIGRRTGLREATRMTRSVRRKAGSSLRPIKPVPPRTTIRSISARGSAVGAR